LFSTLFEPDFFLKIQEERKITKIHALNNNRVFIRFILLNLLL